MSFSHWLESPAQFRQLLITMMSDKWEQLERDFSPEDPVLSQFAATKWAQRRLPEGVGCSIPPARLPLPLPVA